MVLAQVHNKVKKDTTGFLNGIETPWHQIKAKHGLKKIVLYGSSISSFLRNLHTFLIVAVPVCIRTNSVKDSENSIETCITICETDDQCKFDAWSRAPKTSALEQLGGMGSGGRWEGFRTGDTRLPMADLCQRMAKTITIL